VTARPRPARGLRLRRAGGIVGAFLLLGCAAGTTDVPDAPVTVDLDALAPGEAADTADSASAVDRLALDDSADTADSASALDRPAPREDAPLCVGICNAAEPVYPTVTAAAGSGSVTMYTTETSSGGACNYGSTGVTSFAAINVNVEPGDGLGQWQGGRACGQCLEVTAATSRGPASVVVRVMDRCADAYCGVDLGGEAPSAIMLDGFGRYDGIWRLVSCAGHDGVSDGPPALHVVAGSNAWWARVQVRNPPWAVAMVTWRESAGPASGSFPYAADPENTFEVPTEVLQSSASSLGVTVRFGDGTAAGAELTPSQLASPGSSYPLL